MYAAKFTSYTFFRIYQNTYFLQMLDSTNQHPQQQMVVNSLISTWVVIKSLGTHAVYLYIFYI